MCIRDRDKAYIQIESGISLDQFLTEGSPELWEETLNDPQSHVDWVYIGSNNGDAVRAAMEEIPDFDIVYVKKFETASGAIYLKRSRIEGTEETGIAQQQ